jgi:RimJ/RimL family protein N-acetyltransferase
VDRRRWTTLVRGSHIGSRANSNSATPWGASRARGGAPRPTEGARPARERVLFMQRAHESDMILRDVDDGDLPIFFEQQRDEDALRMAAFAARGWDAFMAHWRTKVLGDPSTRKKTIVVNGGVAGNILSWEHGGRRLVGYWIGRDYWGRGVATAALSEFLEHETTRPLYAHVAVHNLGSIRVLEKCGFGRIGEPTKGLDGVDEYLFALDG